MLDADLATAGFVTGLLGLLLFWLPGDGISLAIVGVALSAMRMAQIRKYGGDRRLALGGLICGALGAMAFLTLLAVVSVGYL